MSKKIFWLPMLIATAFFSGCQEKINVNDIDPTAEVKWGIAVPVGSTSATLGNFLADGQVNNLYVGCDGDTNLFYFKDTFSITRTFHDLDLKKYISNVKDTFNIYDKIKSDSRVVDHKITTTANAEAFHLDFPMEFKFKGVNEDTSDERLDSAFITNAEFTSNITVTSGFETIMPWSWVDSVFIFLGKDDTDDSFSRRAGKRLPIYRRGDGSGATDYNKNIPITVDQFTINLMKDLSLPPSRTNVRKVVDFHIEFHFTVPPYQTNVTIPDDAAFNYSLQVEFLTYSAVWGWFKPSGDMRDNHVYSIADEWEPWGEMKKAKLPFYNPTVDLFVNTQVAGAMVLHGDKLYVKTEGASDSVFANFAPNDGDFQMTREEHFDPRDASGYGWTDPVTSVIGDTAHYHVLFSKANKEGRIDKLFARRPDIIGYQFHIDFDSLVTPQIRVTPNTSLWVKAVGTLPFTLNKDYGINWNDTLKDLKLEQYTIDSLAAKINGIDTLKTADMKLFVTTYNEIPLDMYAHLYFLDSLGNVIMDPLNPTDTLRISTESVIRINMAKYSESFSNGTLEPGQTTFILNVGKERTAMLPKIRQMVYNVTADDATLQSSTYGKYPVALRKNQQLRLHVGLAGTIDAVFDVVKMIKQQGK